MEMLHCSFKEKLLTNQANVYWCIVTQSFCNAPNQNKTKIWFTAVQCIFPSHFKVTPILIVHLMSTCSIAIIQKACTDQSTTATLLFSFFILLGQLDETVKKNTNNKLY